MSTMGGGTKKIKEAEQEVECRQRTRQSEILLLLRGAWENGEAFNSETLEKDEEQVVVTDQ